MVKHQMHLNRCKDQKSRTLDEFYTDESETDHPVSRESGKAMLSLITRLRALPDPRRLYGLTSHNHLGLLSEDTSRSAWFVKVAALDKRNYWIEHLMPEANAPWPNAYVQGHAHSEDEAVRMILTAMEKSEGWRGKPYE